MPSQSFFDVLTLFFLVFYYFGPLVFIYLIYIKKGRENQILYASLGFAWLSLSCCCSIFTPSLLNSRRSTWENQCKITLRSLGSTQLAYHYNNARLSYGSWEDLTNPTDPYITPEYTKGNIIDNYEIILFEVKPSTLDKYSKSKNDSTFTIIAIPKSQRNRLRTFGIGEDQTPRVWVGEESIWEKGKASLHDINLWEPLR